VPYAPRGEGERLTLAPVVMPQSCVHAAPGDPTCELRVHHRRDRKTGRQVPVTVVQCRTHGHACTLYPLGHVPYGRLPVAPVAPDGQVLFAAEPAAAAASAQAPAWRTTQFAAAFTAVEAAPVKLTDLRWWATPAPARLTQSALLLGVHPTLTVADADALALRLAIPGLVLRQARAAYAARAAPIPGRAITRPASGAVSAPTSAPYPLLSGDLQRAPSLVMQRNRCQGRSRS
jgi:hypothetical protein